MKKFSLFYKKLLASKNDFFVQFIQVFELKIQYVLLRMNCSHSISCCFFMIKNGFVYLNKVKIFSFIFLNYYDQIKVLKYKFKNNLLNIKKKIIFLNFLVLFLQFSKTLFQANYLIKSGRVFLHKKIIYKNLKFKNKLKSNSIKIRNKYKINRPHFDIF